MIFCDEQSAGIAWIWMAIMGIEWKPLLHMTLGQKRAFFLHYSLHSIFFKVKSYHLRGDRMVLDVLKCFGHFDSIFGLASTDKLNGMTHWLK
ncbi:hypothetical protein PAXRUDRAFT_778829 [Paxillus rubicundulus Ve08.2h10]|uniref:Uncharacterized protein n=1 Tax=Paxillus rubicundulus Ve08.2h10 TaxID=930991 RepID=A0A0D0DYJ2_9AGAM|nr:hypothetical protein PAXRUDRAFT_778829 [Paxillus rubicundulus Ve08.2h10]